MKDLPIGTVVFLFTDIEGSTRLWESHQSEMQADLARHDAILRDSIEKNEGCVFKTMGDAFCAAFSTASQAVLAALQGQQALQSEAWRIPQGLQVRTALHAGEAQARDNDYFGTAVNRVARLLSAAHGGQVLLSASAKELAKDALPRESNLVSLGTHRLKDLSEPQPVFQLKHPDLIADFPSLVTLDNRPNNLRPQPTSLIGREKELEKVLGFLRDEGARLLTLTGPGGMGKSRLGLQAAADAIDIFEHGVFFVELAALDKPDQVLKALVRTLGVVEPSDDSRPLIELLKYYLSPKHMLLLMDNFEQVLDAAHLAVELLAACPGLKMLITSREPLHVRGERELAVPPLDLPDTNRGQSIEQLAQYEAVRLFIDRAVAVRDDFAVTNDNAPAVAEICVRLDGRLSLVASMKTKYGWICDLHENMGLGPRKEKLDWMKAFSYLVKDFCIPERQ